MPKVIADLETATLIDLWKQGRPGHEIAKQFHIELGTVYARVRTLRRQGVLVARTRGVQANSARHTTALEQLPALWTADLPLQRVAEEIHYSIAQTLKLARKLGLPARAYTRRKPLDDQRQAAVVLLRECAWSFQDIAAVLTISRQRAHQLWTLKKKSTPGV